MSCMSKAPAMSKAPFPYEVSFQHVNDAPPSDVIQIHKNAVYIIGLHPDFEAKDLKDVLRRARCKVSKVQFLSNSASVEEDDLLTAKVTLSSTSEGMSHDPPHKT